MGGGKGGAPQPIYTPPPVAPAPETESMVNLADENLTPEQEKAKKQAKTQGAKSLQIPLGT